MKRAVASRSSQNEKVRSAKNTESNKSAKVLRLRIPKRRQIKARNLVLVCLLTALFVWSIYPMRQRSQGEREKRALRAQIKRLRAKNATLRDEVERLKSDDYIEQLARRDLGLVKPGETSLLVVPAKDDETPKKESQNKGEPKAEDKGDPGDKNESEQSRAKKATSETGTSSDEAEPKRSWWQRTFAFFVSLTRSKR